MALYSNVLCTIEGWSITRVIQNNVNKMNEGLCLFPYARVLGQLHFIGVGWNEHDEDTPYLAYRKWHLKEQALLVDVALLGMYILVTNLHINLNVGTICNHFFYHYMSYG